MTDLEQTMEALRAELAALDARDATAKALEAEARQRLKALSRERRRFNAALHDAARLVAVSLACVPIVAGAQLLGAGPVAIALVFVVVLLEALRG